MQMRTNIDNQRRRRDEIPKITISASVEPPEPRPQSFSCFGITRLALDAAVVLTLRVVVAVPEVWSVILVGLSVHAGRLCAPFGDAVNVQVRFSVPE
jgi:hypothetical protein